MKKAASALVALLLAVSISGFAVAAEAQALPGGGFQPGQKLEGFTPIDQYELVLDGTVDREAQIYSNPSPAILVVSKNLESPVVLWPRSRAVESINFMKLSKGERGLDIYPDPVIATHAPFAVAGVEVRFTVGAKQAVLQPPPPILGLHEAAGLREKSSKYASRADYYEPSADLLERLREQGRDVRVRVFFGTWCPACGQMVPRIMKVADQLEGSKLAFEFYGLPKGFAGDTEAEAYDVHSVPTGVVFVDGQEAGRIAGTEWRSPEKAIQDILSGS